MGSELSSTLEPETVAAGGRPLPLSSRYIRLGPFQVDQHREEVTKNGARLKLQGKAYQVLLALIEKQGEVVTREEIHVRLWPADTHVNYDANVNTTVNKLRRALGDSSDQPLYIETLWRKGYCLIIAAEFADSPLPRAEGQDGAPNGSVDGGRTNSAPAKSELWITFGVIGLILAGMLLGAVITRLWIMHFASPVIGGN
jgi:DNA-binding winged helix-turn-helix (wHTH) protein